MSETRDVADEPVRIVPWDPSWVRRFQRERDLLAGLLAPWCTGGVHHVGSTAVRGLAAKPTVDIMAGVSGLQESLPAIAELTKLDYLYAPYRTEEMHWFCKPSPSHRQYHLHLVPTGSRRFQETLAFRDRLRDDAALAERYAALKRELAERFAHDREAYTAAKADFIRGAG